MAVFFTSDLHFGHENLCRGLRNMSAQESDALIIKNWNKVITKRDVVYIVGDFVMEKPKEVEYYLKQLKGIKYLIGGNHDDRQCCMEFSRLGVPVMGMAKYKGYIITHAPVVMEEVKNYAGNIHGHMHVPGVMDGLGEYKGYELDKKYYFNVNVEFNNYTPVPFEFINE